VELYFWTTYLGQRLCLSRTELLSLYSVSRFKYRALPSLEGSGREDRIHTSTHYRWAHDGQYDQRKVVKALICLVPAESFFVPMRRKLSYNLPTMALLQAQKSLPPCHCPNPIGTASDSSPTTPLSHAVMKLFHPFLVHHNDLSLGIYRYSPPHFLDKRPLHRPNHEKYPYISPTVEPPPQQQCASSTPSPSTTASAPKPKPSPAPPSGPPSNTVTTPRSAPQKQQNPRLWLERAWTAISRITRFWWMRSLLIGRLRRRWPRRARQRVMGRWRRRVGWGWGVVRWRIVCRMLWRWVIRVEGRGLGYCE